MLNPFRVLGGWLGGIIGREPSYGIVRVVGDELPSNLDPGAVYIAGEEGVDWVAGLICPCGCGRTMELMLLLGVKPRWDVRPGRRGGATVRPSVWAATGCKSHFWLTDGEVRWCRDRSARSRSRP